MRIQVPWLVPLDYAKPIVLARALKSRLLRPEVIREIALAKDFDEALGALGESIYSGIREAKNLLQVSMVVWRGYFRTVLRLADSCPHPLREVALLFAREEELKDLMIIAQKVKLRSPIQERLPSMFYEGTIVYFITREPERLLSLENLMKTLEGKWPHEYLSEILSLIEEHRLETPLHVFSPLYVVRMYSETLEPLSSIDIKDLETILCPKLEPLLISSLIHNKAYDVPVDVMRAILRPVDLCGWRIKSFLDAYERAIDYKSLADDIGRILETKITGETLPEILANVLVGGGRRLRKIASKTMMGDPYRPSFIIAPLVLLKLEVEDILLILSSKIYKVKPEDILSRLSIET